MIDESHKRILKNNWGERADTLNCYAEVKLIDPLSSWACYIYAMDNDEEFINCVLYSRAMGVDITAMAWRDVLIMFNEHGERPIIDREFRKIRVTQLLKDLE